MNPNSSISENEFMPAGQQSDDPMFQNFMQACLNNPSFFESMKQFYTHANQPRSNPPANTRNNNPFQANPYNPSTVSLQSSRPDDYRGSYDDEEELESTSQKEFRKDNRKLPANPLLKYQPQEQGTSENSNMARRAVQVQPDPKPNLFEEQPIKSRYIQNISTAPSNRASVDLNAIKQNQSINIEIVERGIKPGKPAPKESISRNFDDQPIRGMKAEDMEREFRIEERPIKGMNKDDLEYYQEFPEKTTKMGNKSTKPAPNSKVLDDDRPITGAKKDFKQLIKEQFEAFGQDIEEEQEQPEEKKVEPRNFLKRGSRQHLSSAMNKSKQPKKIEDDLNKSGLDRSRDLTPKNQNRSVSQNRVLGKRNTRETNDKSINKGVPKNCPPQNEETSNSRARPPLGNTKQRKAPPAVPSKPSNVPKADTALSKKKKTKNVFDDNSSSSSSEDEPNFKTTASKPTSMAHDFNEDRTQVIENVFLTSEQLDLILQKFGKASKPVPQETESDKIRIIRNKYTELCQLVQTEREAHQADLEREKEEFEKYKADQLNKIKNQRRVMERQLKSGSSNQNLQKDREELENLKQELEREREDFKKKDKNNRIMVEKFKKQNEELKSKIQRLEADKDSAVGSKRSLNIYKTEEQVEQKSPLLRQSGKPSKKEEQPAKEEVSYRDIKKGRDGKQAVAKVKYEYAEQQPVAKSKPTNVQREVKIENKWVSNKAYSDSDSPASEQEEQQASSALQWSPTMKLCDLTKIDLSIKMVSDQMIAALFRFETNIEYRRYQQAVKSAGRTVVNSTRNSKNSYVANLYSDRSKEHLYDNGTRKETLESGYTIIYFKNGDIKQTLPDQTILYYFKEKAVDQITLPNSVNIYRFENNQVEFHFPNGYIEIRHPDGTIKVLGEHTRR